MVHPDVDVASISKFDALALETVTVGIESGCVQLTLVRIPVVQTVMDPLSVLPVGNCDAGMLSDWFG